MSKFAKDMIPPPLNLFVLVLSVTAHETKVLEQKFVMSPKL